MRIRIHRGTQEIGGTCIEMEAGGCRIALDVGMPLDAGEADAAGLLPAVAGFREHSDDLAGIVISHPHQDHYGLARHVRADVPVYIGEAANNILAAAAKYVPDGHWFANARFYRDRRPLSIGTFTITPYLVDHSAFDAYALLVEAEGRRVFYSGDFRAHGRKSGLVERIFETPPKDIDILMMEGTTIGRTDTAEGAETEADLERRFAAAFEATPGAHLVWTSAQNIDRIVTVFRAAKRTGRLLVIDLYTAVVLEATGKATIPQSWWNDIRLYIPYRQRVQIKKLGLFDDLRRHSANRVYTEDLAAIRQRTVVLFRPPLMDDQGIDGILDGARLTYSMWRGYLDHAGSRRVIAWLEANGMPWETIHTSGHAPLRDLKRLATALAPDRLVPIHSFETARFKDHFANVELKEDGVWWDV